MGALEQLSKLLSKQGPPGPPPRSGLAWNPQTHRWIHEPTGATFRPSGHSERHERQARSLVEQLQAVGDDHAEMASSAILSSLHSERPADSLAHTERAIAVIDQALGDAAKPPKVKRALRSIQAQLHEQVEARGGTVPRTRVYGRREVMRSLVAKQGPPGPPPRPGLEWNPQTHRWRHPQTGSELGHGEFEDLKDHIEDGLGRAKTEQARQTFQEAARAGNRGDYREARRLAGLGSLANAGVDVSNPEEVRRVLGRVRQSKSVLKGLMRLAKLTKR